MPLPDAGHLPGGGLPAPLGYKRKSVLLRVNLTHISSPPQGWVSWAEEEGMRPWPLTWKALLLSSSLLGLFSLGLSGCEALSPCCPHLLPSTALLCPLLIIPKGTHILTQAWLPVFPHSSHPKLSEWLFWTPVCSCHPCYCPSSGQPTWTRLQEKEPSLAPKEVPVVDP